MKERSRFEVSVLTLLVIIVIYQFAIFYKLDQTNEQIKALYYDFASLIGK